MFLLTTNAARFSVTTVSLFFYCLRPLTKLRMFRTEVFLRVSFCGSAVQATLIKAEREIGLFDVVKSQALWQINKPDRLTVRPRQHHRRQHRRQRCCYQPRFDRFVFTIVVTSVVVIFIIAMAIGRRARYRCHFGFTLFVANY